MRQEAPASYDNGMNKNRNLQRQIIEEQKQKVKQDFTNLKEGKKDFHKLLVQAKVKRVEALQAGNKEEAKHWKEEMERLNQEWRDEQKKSFRNLRRDRQALWNEKKKR